MSTHWKTNELARAKAVYEELGCDAAAKEVGRSMTAIYCAAHRHRWRRCRVARMGSIARTAIVMAAECGVTAIELSAETGKPLETVRPILSKLVLKGKLAKSNTRIGMYVVP